MRKITLLFIALCLLVACRHHHSSQNLIPAGGSVVVLGDSLSYGIGAEPNQSYPSLLEKTTGWHIINAGIPGDTSAQGLERLDPLLAAHHPRLLIVELGGNDMLHQAPAGEIEATLKTILAQAKQQGVPTVLVAIPKPSVYDAAFGDLADHPLYEKVSKETGTPLIANVFSKVLSKGALKADQLHPNAKGYEIVAAEMQEALKDEGFLQ
jgi:acyl-CoA thioesterase I